MTGEIPSNFEKKRILVVGGAGFVGSNLVKKVLETNPASVIVVDNLLSAEHENLPPDSRVDFIEGSITDVSILSRLNDDLDYIFHLATYHGNQSSICNPLIDHENNTLTTLKLMERVKDFKNLKKLVYSSAGCSVAKKTFNEVRATTEDDPISLEQDSPYSISKIIGEFYSVYYHTQYRLPAVRARFQNVYGPGEVLGAGQWRGTYATVWRNVTPTFIYKALKGRELPLENNGIATRDFIYVDDIVNGLILCALRGKPGDVYNIASGVETSIRELAEIINNKTGNPTPVKNVPGRPWDHSGRRFGSTEKSKRELGFEAKVSLNKGLEKTIQWTRENIGFIEKCMGRHAGKCDIS